MWLVSVACRPLVPLIDLARWFGIALLDAWQRRVRWFGDRLRRKWRWQATAALVFVACAALTVVSLR